MTSTVKLLEAIRAAASSRFRTLPAAREALRSYIVGAEQHTAALGLAPGGVELLAAIAVAKAATATLASAQAAHDTITKKAAVVRITAPAPGPAASPCISSVLSDAMWCFDVAKCQWGAALTFLNGGTNPTTENTPAAHIIARIRESQKPATLAKYFRLVNQLPETVQPAGAVAALDTEFGAGAWRHLFDASLENHPARAHGRLASALVAGAGTVRASLAALAKLRTAAPVAAVAEYDRILRMGYKPKAKSAEAFRQRELVRAAALIEEYDSLSGKAAVDFYQANRCAILHAREMLAGRAVDRGAFPHLTGLSRAIVASQAARAASAGK